MKIIYSLCILLFSALLISNCTLNRKENPTPEEPKAFKDKIVLYDLAFNSDTTQVIIQWSLLENDDFVSYDLYRTELNDVTFNADNIDLKQFQFIASIRTKGATSYTDTALPYGPYFKYIVVARTKASATPYFVSNAKEVQIKNKYLRDKIHEIFHNGADNQVIVLSKSAATLSIYDYYCNLIKRVTIPNKALVTDPYCFGFMGTFKNQPELYIPSGGIIYIYNPRTLDLIDHIDTGNTFQWSVSSYRHLLFVGGAVINRETKEVIKNHDRTYDFYLIGREFPIKNKISNFINSFYISLDISPDDLGVNYYHDNGEYVSTVGDSYHGTYPLNPRLCKVAPNGLYLITDTRGAIYDYSLTFQKYLGGEPTNNWPMEGRFFDFEFNEDGSLIYAAMNNEKNIGVYDSKFNLLEYIPLNGFPVRIFRQNNELIVAIAERSLREVPTLDDLQNDLHRVRFQRVKL